LSRPKLRGVLLCEDVEHERFFLRLLSPKWFAQRKLRVERIPNNQGAGDAWVLERYAKEVRFARSKRSENWALIVAIDGDHYKLKERLRQLEKRLRDEGLSGRNEGERIVVFIPTRSIETWELWLCGERQIDESKDFKDIFRRAQNASGKKAVEAWLPQLSPKEEVLEKKRLPSLAAGRKELERLSSTK